MRAKIVPMQNSANRTKPVLPDCETSRHRATRIKGTTPTGPSNHFSVTVVCLFWSLSSLWKVLFLHVSKFSQSWFSDRHDFPTALRCSRPGCRTRCHWCLGVLLWRNGLAFRNPYWFLPSSLGYGMYRPFMGKFFFHGFTHLRTAWKPRALTSLETVQELFLNFWHYFA